MVSTLNLNLLPKALPVSRTEQIMQKLSVFNNLSNYTNIAKKCKDCTLSISFYYYLYFINIWDSQFVDFLHHRETIFEI